MLYELSLKNFLVLTVDDESFINISREAVGLWLPSTFDQSWGSQGTPSDRPSPLYKKFSGLIRLSFFTSDDSLRTVSWVKVYFLRTHFYLFPTGPCHPLLLPTFGSLVYQPVTRDSDAFFTHTCPPSLFVWKCLLQFLKPEIAFMLSLSTTYLNSFIH